LTDLNLKGSPMADINAFVKRLDEQMAQARSRVEEKQSELQHAYEARAERYKTFLRILQDLQGVAKPRLEKLAEHCKFQASPIEDADGKSVTLNFQTPVAKVRLRLSATHDTEVRNFVLGYDLEILPIFIQFKPHAELQIPLEKVDRATVESWLDERLIEFAQTYVTIHFTDQYNMDHLVTDPVANVRFPKVFAQSTLEKSGKTYYFISDQTRREFAQRP
jgi:YHS domain-containing protein